MSVSLGPPAANPLHSVEEAFVLAEQCVQSAHVLAREADRIWPSVVLSAESQAYGELRSFELFRSHGLRNFNVSWTPDALEAGRAEQERIENCLRSVLPVLRHLRLPCRAVATPTHVDGTEWASFGDAILDRGSALLAAAEQHRTTRATLYSGPDAAWRIGGAAWRPGRDDLTPEAAVLSGIRRELARAAPALLSLMTGTAESARGPVQGEPPLRPRAAKRERRDPTAPVVFVTSTDGRDPSNKRDVRAVFGIEDRTARDWLRDLGRNRPTWELLKKAGEARSKRALRSRRRK